LREARLTTLAPEHVEPIRHLLIATNAFNEEEVRVAIELVESSLLAPQGDYQVLVLTAGSEVIGYTCFGRAPFTEAAFDLYWIAVAPPWHGRGAARMLMTAAEREIRRRGGCLILVETASRETYSRARRFYESLGYREIARILGYYRIGDDKVLYEKRWLDGDETETATDRPTESPRPTSTCL
jgi:ribosomal protein S18 acetylase RimI-like enzyme